MNGKDLARHGNGADAGFKAVERKISSPPKNNNDNASRSRSPHTPSIHTHPLNLTLNSSLNMTRISPIPEKGSSPDTARTSADDNSSTTPDLQTQTQWSIGERPTPSASQTSMNEMQTPGPANIKAKGTPKKGAGSKKPDALTNASFPLPIEPPTSTINTSGDVLAILKLSTSEKKNRIIDVGKVVDANFRVLGDHSAHIGEDIAELSTRLDNLEVADLTSTEGGLQDTSLPSRPVSAGVGILHDLKSRISALEEETDEEVGNDIRGAETEKMVKKLRGDISNLKDKAELDRQFAKTLATPKDVNDARTFATREVAMLYAVQSAQKKCESEKVKYQSDIVIAVVG
ncbi:MAG: hypothetical protein NXY57DRAFT_1062940, partial [Lentinula lateritia]